jgi:thiol:disulfide interchange protein
MYICLIQLLRFSGEKLKKVVVEVVVVVVAVAEVIVVVVNAQALGGITFTLQNPNIISQLIE